MFSGQKLWAASFDPYFDLTLLGDFYATPGKETLNNGQLHGRFKLLSQREETRLYLDLGAGGLVGKKAENYFILPQSYISVKSGENFEFTVGRIIKNYSQLDTYWMLGDVMPLFRWDAARVEIQGLPGLFMGYQPNKSIQFDLFASYLYLPSQGPSFSVVDGKLMSGNPWFSRPVDILDLSGVPYDLKYSVNTPDISKIVLKPSFGASLFLQSPDEFFWARMSYFLKQRNEIITPIEGTLNLASHIGDIQVHPVVADHKLTTMDFGLKGSSWGLTLSALYESNVKFSVDPSWILYPHYSDQYKLGMNALYQVTSFHTLEMGFLRTFNNQVTVQGISGASSVDAYSFRNQYDNVVDLRLTSVFFPRDNGFLFKSKARIAYDYHAETTLVSLEGIYSPFADVSTFIRGDLFGGSRNGLNYYNNILVNYLNKDRIQAGVKYVF